MTCIEIAALLTSLLAVAAFGTLVYQLCDAADRIWLICLGLFGLPLSALAFYGVRLPLDSVLTAWFGKGSTLLTVCQLWYAPLTEEPAKLLPLLIAWPIFRRTLYKEFGNGFPHGPIARATSTLPVVFRKDSPCRERHVFV